MIRATRSCVALLVFLGIAAVPVACGGDKKPADSPPVPTASAASSTVLTPPAGAQDAGPAAADAAPPASPLSTILTTDPNQLTALLQAAASASPALLQQPGSVPNDLIEAGIKASASAHAKGMQPDGPIAKGDLKEGDHLSMTVTLHAGKCYAIVGFSPRGSVHDLDLRLLAPPFYNLLSGEDTTDDHQPVIGKDPSPMCPIVPVPMAYKVDIHAQKGAGKVGVQVYSKTAPNMK